MADNAVKVAAPSVTLIVGLALSIVDSSLALLVLLQFYIAESSSLIIESVLLRPDGPEISVSLRSPTNTVETSLPGDFARNTPPRNVSEELLIEIYCCTGVLDEAKYNVLIAYMGRIQ
jgi:hypothetical protein